MTSMDEIEGKYPALLISLMRKLRLIEFFHNSRLLINSTKKNLQKNSDSTKAPDYFLSCQPL